MDNTVSQEVRIYPDIELLSHEAAREMVSLVNTVAAEKDSFTIALSGGRTPAVLYQLMAGKYSSQIPWDKVHIFWGDERYVPANHADSNFAMASKMLISHISIPAQNIHPVPTELKPIEKAAGAYEQMLKKYFKNSPFPCLDLILLGVGEDGHTASLFPGDSAIEMHRLVMPVIAPANYPPRDRITLTLPVINSADNVFFIAAGSEKGKVVRSILEDRETARRRYPAAMVQPKGRIIWFLDNKAYTAHKN
jgi:6-phosphogluconolactonase